MKIAKFSRCLQLTLALAALALPLSAQLTQTLPAGFDTTDGNSSSPFPVNLASAQTWQWVYDSSQFAVQGPIVITDISIRAQGPTFAVAAFNFSNWDVTLATASTNYAAANHNATFASNILSSQVCRTGPWSHAAVPASGAGAATFIPMGLSQTFAYDPSSGNDFIVEIRTCGGSTLWATGLDCVSGAAGTVGGNRYGNLTSCTATTQNNSSNELAPVIQISYVTPNAVDGAVTLISAPSNTTTDCGLLSPTASVTSRLTNLGTSPIASGTVIPMTLAVDGSTIATEMMTITSNLALGQFQDYTFTATANVQSNGTHMVTTTCALAGDLNPANDSLTKNVVSGNLNLVTTFPFAENFDSYTTSANTTTPPPTWRQDTTDGVGTNSDWIFRTTEPTSLNGPSADHTTGASGVGRFAYVEDDGNFAAVNLITPCLKLDAAVIPNPALAFWLHSNNSDPNPTTTNQNFLHVDAIVYPGAVLVPDIAAAVGHLGNSWQLQLINLTAFIGQTIQLQFRGTTNGGSTTHDIAIDDLQVFNFVPSAGQAPQPGFAVLDINGARDTLGFSVPQAVNGPYFANASLTGSINFKFEGAPNQPIVLLIGNLNPNLVNYPGFGRMDIGTGINAMNGFPVGVSILADGTQLTLPNIFFRTTATGVADISFGTPLFPLGVLTTFQAVLLAPAPQLAAITNAVQLSIVP